MLPFEVARTGLKKRIDGLVSARIIRRLAANCWSVNSLINDENNGLDELETGRIIRRSQQKVLPFEIAATGLKKRVDRPATGCIICRLATLRRSEDAGSENKVLTISVGTG